MTPEPVADLDAAESEILDQADEFVAAKRREFVLVLQHAPLDVLVEAIKSACLRGFGIWQEPTPSAGDSTKRRPATHLFEINFLGLEARGFGAAEAARNWRTAALNQIDPSTQDAAA